MLPAVAQRGDNSPTTVAVEATSNAGAAALVFTAARIVRMLQSYANPRDADAQIKLAAHLRVAVHLRVAAHLQVAVHLRVAAHLVVAATS